MNKNAFDVLRIFAVVQVMLLHFNAFYFQYSSDAFYQYREIVKMFPGVVILFSLSGFLIASSFEKSASFKKYFQKRILRIYPPLWLCTIINLTILFFLGQNIFNKSILFWICTQIVGIANTPSFLRDFATGSINGSLWTIFTEVQLYIVLGCTYHKLKKMTGTQINVIKLTLKKVTAKKEMEEANSFVSFLLLLHH